jgi:hypothetical protein
MFILISSNSTGDIAKPRIWTERPRDTISRFGVFNLKRDSIEMHLRGGQTLTLVSRCDVDMGPSFLLEVKDRQIPWVKTR